MTTFLSLPRLNRLLVTSLNSSKEHRWNRMNQRNTQVLWHRTSANFKECSCNTRFFCKFIFFRIQLTRSNLRGELFRVPSNCRRNSILWIFRMSFDRLFQKNAAYVIIGEKRWRDPSVVGVVSLRGSRNDLRKVVLFEDSKSTRREVGCIKPLSRTDTLILFIAE